MCRVPGMTSKATQRNPVSANKDGLTLLLCVTFELLPPTTKHWLLLNTVKYINVLKQKGLSIVVPLENCYSKLGIK